MTRTAEIGFFLAAAMASGTAWAQTAAAPAAEPAEEEEEPGVEAGYGRLKLGGLFQVWNTTVFAEDCPDYTPGCVAQGGPSNWTNTFRVRRTELKLDAVIVEDAVEAGVMVDPAKEVFGRSAGGSPSNAVAVDTDGNPATPPDLVPRYRTNESILQDLFVLFTLRKHLQLKVGQFKRPLGFEGPYSAAKIMFDERSQVSLALTGDNRDLGAVATLSLDAAHLTMDLGVFNGTPIVGGATTIRSGLNEDDQNAFKDMVLRIGAQPIEHLEVGVSGLFGFEGSYHAGSPDPGTATDLRYGAWVRWATDRLDLRAEGMAQAFNEVGRPVRHARGGYVLGEYRVVPKIGVGARLDYYDSNASRSSLPGGDRSVDTNVTVGVNWYIDDFHAKAQIAYTASIEGDLSSDDTAPESGQKADDQVTLVAQVAF